MSMEGEELERIKRIYRGPCQGHFPHVNFLLDLLETHDQRINGLLDANSALVSARRVAEGRVEHFTLALDFMTRQTVRLQAERGCAIEERDMARQDAAVAWREAARYMREVDQNSKEIGVGCEKQETV